MTCTGEGSSLVRHPRGIGGGCAERRGVMHKCQLFLKNFRDMGSHTTPFHAHNTPTLITSRAGACAAVDVFAQIGVC